MRNSLGGWFVLGLFLPMAVFGFGVLIHGMAVGLMMPPIEQLRILTAVVLVYALARALAHCVALGSRPQRRHELFTPLYDQRRHEWTSRLA